MLYKAQAKVRIKRAEREFGGFEWFLGSHTLVKRVELLSFHVNHILGVS